VSPERHKVLKVLRESEGVALSAPELAKKAGVAPSTARAYLRRALWYYTDYPWANTSSYYPRDLQRTYEGGRWLYWIGERKEVAA
jgi:hypothetical protein